jgi:hypothetical protein
MERDLHRPSVYDNWADSVEKLLVELKDQTEFWREKGYTIVGYGAAAKGMTLINASDIELDCVIDDNQLKQGKYCPGTDIPVVGIDWLNKLSDTDKVLFIPLAWNFYREIKQKIKAKRDCSNDMFMRYFPKIEFETQ